MWCYDLHTYSGGSGCGAEWREGRGIWEVKRQFLGPGLPVKQRSDPGSDTYQLCDLEQVLAFLVSQFSSSVK